MIAVDIDVNEEASSDFIPIRDACKLFPRPGGRRTSLPTVYRWTLRGIKGVVLKTAQVGAVRCTTRAWIAEFVEAVTAKRDRTSVADRAPVCVRTRKQRNVSENLDALLGPKGRPAKAA